jgi:hypothetical protein
MFAAVSIGLTAEEEEALQQREASTPTAQVEHWEDWVCYALLSYEVAAFHGDIQSQLSSSISLARNAALRALR